MVTVGSKRTQDIKRAQKEKLLFREISQLLSQLVLDDSRLRTIWVSRIELSPDKGICYVYFYTPEGLGHFEETLEVLKLYKPSLRTAIAHIIESRYTPEFIFKFDNTYEKQEKIINLLDKLATKKE